MASLNERTCSSPPRSCRWVSTVLAGPRKQLSYTTEPLPGPSKIAFYFTLLMLTLKRFVKCALKKKSISKVTFGKFTNLFCCIDKNAQVLIHVCSISYISCIRLFCPLRLGVSLRDLRPSITSWWRRGPLTPPW